MICVQKVVEISTTGSTFSLKIVFNYIKQNLADSLFLIKAMKSFHIYTKARYFFNQKLTPQFELNCKFINVQP